MGSHKDSLDHPHLYWQVKSVGEVVSQLGGSSRRTELYFYHGLSWFNNNIVPQTSKHKEPL